MMRRAILLIACIAACDDSTDEAPTVLNLVRPIDIAFACYGGLRITGGAATPPDQPIITSAQPIQSCDSRSVAPADGQTARVPPGQEILSPASNPGQSWYYAFILQSAPGTVGIAQWNTMPSSSFTGDGDVTVVDADPLTPGKNSISVGEDPVALATDKIGCYEITALAGSCDMSSLNINTALDYATNNTVALSNHETVQVDRFAVNNASGVALRAKPAAMVAEPPGGTIGVACPAQPTGLVYVAYPSCHLVAAVDVSSGTIVAGIQYDASGTANIVDGNVTCPDECGGGGVIAAGPRPVTLDLQLDANSARRALAIGSDNSNVVTIVELGIDSLPLSLSNVVLQNPTGTLGVTGVKISPEIGMGGSMGFINDDSALGGLMQFVYAVATDHTVRVANIENVVNKECDAQVDPRYLYADKNVKQLSCMPVGDPATPPRRAGAHGPGIQLPGSSVPTSIDIFKVEPIVGDTNLPGTPTRFIGYFGVITSASGATYMLNVDDDDYADDVDPTAPIGTSIPLDIANQLRDALPDRGMLPETENAAGMEVAICDDPGPDPDAADSAGVPNTGGPREDGDPQRTLPVGLFAVEKVAELPSIRQVLCTGADETKPVNELSYSAPVPVRDLEFPDLRNLFADEIWTFTWEGSLSIDTIDSAANGPDLRTGQIFVDANGMRLDDQTNAFCNAGVEPYDIVQLRGCDPSLGNADCPLGYTCFVHPQSQVAGLGACMLTDEADRLADACEQFLTSLRLYTAGPKTTSGELQLLPRKRVLGTTPIDGCTSDAQCQVLGTYALQLEDPANPIDDTTAPDSHTYSCQVDLDRAPELDATGAAPMKRCIETCNVDADCFAGTVCSNGFCMEGVIPPQACVNAAQRFDLRASEAFAVAGVNSGFIHPIIADANGNCIKDPNAPPVKIGRLPLRAPACDPTADPHTGQRPDGTFEPNPCEETTNQVELGTVYSPGTCTLAATPLSTRSTDAIKFRNPGMTITMVDPTYPGDTTCINDRQGTLGKIPVVPSQYQTSVRIDAGFTPQILGIAPAYPVKVTRGPGESIWVIDDGDYLSTSIDIASTAGKVFRIESASIAIINTLE